EFVTANFKEGVESIADLKPGMRLQGVVTNVANFGAFVDIGVHQDGLVHVSQLSDRFVRDPREAVKAGQVVSVTVVEVDAARKRIALSMKSKPTLASRSGDERASSGGPSKPPASGTGRSPAPSGSGPARPASGGAARQPAAASEPTALGAALARLISR
ncbi:MAG: S1 RNA-binding domain-containing protein, partial [Actinobacteria bacterium]|nr:S1 RNA-binding domain-containing protein [Actinomycetota bacterium]